MPSAVVPPCYWLGGVTVARREMASQYRYRIELWLPISPRGWGPPSFVWWISVRSACLPDACRIRSMSRIQSRGRIRHVVGHACCVLNTGGVRRDPVTTWPGRVPNASAGLTIPAVVWGEVGAVSSIWWIYEQSARLMRPCGICFELSNSPGERSRNVAPSMNSTHIDSQASTLAGRLMGQSERVGPRQFRRADPSG